MTHDQDGLAGMPSFLCKSWTSPSTNLTISPSWPNCSHHYSGLDSLRFKPPCFLTIDGGFEDHLKNDMLVKIGASSPSNKSKNKGSRKPAPTSIWNLMAWAISKCLAINWMFFSKSFYEKWFKSQQTNIHPFPGPFPKIALEFQDFGWKTHAYISRCPSTQNNAKKNSSGDGSRSRMEPKVLENGNFKHPNSQGTRTGVPLTVYPWYLAGVLGWDSWGWKKPIHTKTIYIYILRVFWGDFPYGAPRF